jgi:hypothetical protein
MLGESASLAKSLSFTTSEINNIEHHVELVVIERGSWVIAAICAR